MIYFCADDYGLNVNSSRRIYQCLEKGTLNKVSVFPNFEQVDICELVKDKHVRVSLHLNLVEGKCMANADELGLLVDKNGNFKHTFGGLFQLNLTCAKELREQAYKEIKAQVLFFRSVLPENVPFCIDSHQHTYMIPAIFKALIQVLKDENIPIEYMRIPAEPLLPYLATPSLYMTYSAVNVVKQWLLRFLWLIDKQTLKAFPMRTAYFLGILFSGKMDEQRVMKILPKYSRLANKSGCDIEVLFHPGYLEKSEAQESHIVFHDFYVSPNRKIEFDAVMKLSERSVS